ncbi:MAG TPA: hypothetical protein VGB75_13245 [Jatrophihabitans sp.]|uniref:hypothetical protein n=1 Tax=Jatrophihabitans sp. TaxID=1932789 RepID=UPI002F00543E
MTAAGFQDLPEAEFASDHDLCPDPDHDLEAARFDDSDGAYAVAEPDPFSHPAALPLRRPVLRAEQRAELRAELASQQAGALNPLTTPTLPPLPVPPGLRQLLPDGLRRGSTVAVTSSVSLLLALLGPASAAGAWTAMVGMPAISAEAADEAGMELERLAIISPPMREDRSDAGARTGPNGNWEPGWTGSSWTTAVGALLDAVDVVVARPGGAGGVPADRDGGDPGAFGRNGGITDGEARRLTARARSKGAILVLFGQQAASWPAVEIELSATHGRWVGIDRGYGRLRQRQLRVAAIGRGRSARPRGADLWL